MDQPCTGAPISTMVIIQFAFPCGDRRIWLYSIAGYDLISIHVLAWGTTERELTFSWVEQISIHVPNVGNDVWPAGTLCPGTDISIHVPNVGNDDNISQDTLDQFISIHVPYAGNDRMPGHITCVISISIHVPYTGNDHVRCGGMPIRIAFQSTFPIQGTTRS